VLLVSDITPKTFALGFPAAVARLTARPLSAVALTFRPLARPFVPEEAEAAAPLSESEFKALLIASERSGQVAPAERELIDKVFAFGSRRVSEIMTPRERIFALDLDTAVDRQSQQYRGCATGQGSSRAAAGVGATATGAANSRTLFRAAGQDAGRIVR
jgi:CBS domain containing-hemolysin-like protein